MEFMETETFYEVILFSTPRSNGLAIENTGCKSIFMSYSKWDVVDSSVDWRNSIVSYPTILYEVFFYRQIVSMFFLSLNSIEKFKVPKKNKSSFFDLVSEQNI